MNQITLEKLPIRSRIDYFFDSLELGRLSRLFKKENHECRTVDDVSFTELYHDYDIYNPYIREVTL